MKQFIVKTLAGGREAYVRRKGRDRWGRTPRREWASRFTDEAGVPARVARPYEMIDGDAETASLPGKRESDDGDAETASLPGGG